jgi:hypothetical protein
MERQIEDLNQAAATNGLIIGIITSVIGIVIYYVAPSLMGSLSFGIGVSALSLVLYIIFTIDLRKKIGNFWSFRTALKGIFLMAFTAGIVNMAINFVFYRFIEPAAFEKISGFISESMAANYERFGMDQDKIDQMVALSLEKLKTQLKPGPMDLLKNLTIQILVQFIMSLIFAAIFKKEPPVFAPREEE